MSKRSKSLDTEDLIYAGLGALASLAVNPIVNKAVQNQAEGTRKMIGTAMPVVKGLGGAYLATQKKQSKKLRFFGLGMVAESALELGIKAKPDLFAIGATGDLYRSIGSSAVTYPILPGASMETERREAPFVSEPVVGGPKRMPVL